MRESKVALVYTGGTLGMVRTERGFAASPNLAELLAARVPELGSDALPAFELINFGAAADSADFGPRTWYELASLIRGLAPDYEGFVVIHGTDTMAYTASALSFLLADVAVPVVLTGSQLPLGELRSDARTNLLTAMEVATAGRLREVTICFGHTVLRGNRATKVHSVSFDAFASPNFPPLASVGAEVRFGSDAPLPAFGRIAMTDYHDARIVALPVYPGIDVQTVRAIAQAAPDGLLLECYGMGTFPGRDQQLLGALAGLVQGGTVVVAISQCLTGGASLDRYAAGHILLDGGVLSGADMTREAALTKLHWLLGRGLSTSEIAAQVSTDVRGELTVAASQG